MPDQSHAPFPPNTARPDTARPNTARQVDFRHAPPRAWTCIGRPDDPFKTLVDERGRLLYDFRREGARFGTFRFGRVVSFAPHSAATPLRITQRTASAAVPVVITRLEYAHVTLTLTAFGHLHRGSAPDPEGALRTDVVIWQLEPAPSDPSPILHEHTHPPAATPHAASPHAPQQPLVSGLWLEIQCQEARFAPAGLAPSSRIYAHDPAHAPRWRGLQDLFALHRDPAPAEAATSSSRVWEGPPAPFLVSAPHPLQVASAFDCGPASGLRTDFAPIHAGQPLRGALFFPQNHDQIAAFDLEWAEAALAEEHRFWQSYDLLPNRIILPDPDIMDMVTACARNILQAREIQAGLPEFQVGPTVYRGLWIIDGYFFLEAAQFTGRRAEAYRGIDALLRRVRPNGAIEERSLDTKDTGLALATIVRQCELMNDDARLRALWPTLRRAVAYVQELRAQTLALAADDQGGQSPGEQAARGPLPDSFANGGLGGIRAEYTTILWMLVGVQAVARAARRLGLDEEAADVEGFFQQLYTAFRAHAARDQQTLPDGTRYLPMCIPGSGSHHWIHNYPGTPPPWEAINPGTGTWAFAHAIYPGQLFAPDDPLVQDFCALLERLDDAQGIPAATGWLPFAAVWTYAASFYAHVWLYAAPQGHPPDKNPYIAKAVDYLYAFANHAAPTRVWREEQSLAHIGLDQQIGDMPHNWASAEFIRLVRNLLIFERGATLELLPGLPPTWLYPGAELLLERMPTHFGPITLHLTVAADRSFSLRVRTDPAWPHPPAAFLLHLPVGAMLHPHNGVEPASDLTTPAVGQTPGATAPTAGALSLPWRAELTLTGQLPD